MLAWLLLDKDQIFYFKITYLTSFLYFAGGKGRTGTMICVWLVEAGVFSTATQSLDYFGNRRTDTNVSKKFQGVSSFILSAGRVVCN